MGAKRQIINKIENGFSKSDQKILKNGWKISH